MVASVALTPEGIRLLDQRALPAREEYVLCRTHRELARAIRDMVVRGAPAIGIAAAYGMVLAARALAPASPGSDAFLDGLRAAAAELAATRPTAVNLTWALERMLAAADRAAWQGRVPREVLAALEAEARAIHEEDLAMNRRIGALGAELVPDGASVLTHCNAGALATGGFGTALGVLRAARAQGKRLHVFVDETRPLLQGARLTAWELMQEGIPATLIADGMAGHFMRLGRVDLVIVGADRICRNGDVVNKIGTYGLAVLAREHGIPFYVAAPWSTVDLALPSGDAVVIEERAAEEVLGFGPVRWAPEGVAVANPAFDVTPARYVTAIITDRGLARPPYDESLQRLAAEAPQGGLACLT